VPAVLADQSFVLQNSHRVEFPIDNAIRTTEFFSWHRATTHLPANIGWSLDMLTAISSTFSFKLSVIFFACSSEIPSRRLKLMEAFLSRDTVPWQSSTRIMGLPSSFFLATNLHVPRSTLSSGI